jgi:hypothetical protein
MEFEICKDKKLDGFCFKVIKDASIEDLKMKCNELDNCVGFDTNGHLFFFVPEEKLVDHPGTTTYIHKKKIQSILSQPNDKNGCIPKKIHFIWFKKGRAFNLLNYIAVKSTLYHCSDYEINIHCDAEPESNIYFNDLKKRDRVCINNFEEVTKLNGHPISHFQHRCDVIRLKILSQYGGIYMDLDNILIKSLDDFIDKKMVMGYERGGNKNGGLIANGVIMVEKDNPMIKEWLSIYDSSWGESFVPYWNGHSIHIPFQLSFKYHYLMSIQSNKTFYPFLWDDMSILNKNNDNGKNYEGSYSVQLWETESSKTDLLPQTPLYFKTYKNAFTRLFGHLVEDLVIDSEDEFIVIDGYDMNGCDTGCVGRRSPKELKRICKNNPDAVAINSLGFLKFAVGLNHLVSFSKKTQYCHPQDKLYIIKDRCYSWL